MIRRLSLFCMFSVVSGALLAPPAAHAFTLENDPAKSTIPNFDFDEQLRQFRTPQGLGTSADAAKKGYETPFGTLQFGVQKGNISPFRSPFVGSQFGASNSGHADRKHFERLFVHPDLQHRYD